MMRDVMTAVAEEQHPMVVVPATIGLQTLHHMARKGDDPLLCGDS